MGIIIHTVEVPDLFRYRPELNPNGTEKHIVCEGARFHVVSWSLNRHGSVTRCSEKNCELNRPTGKDR